ncbi:hypothetical protein D046_5591B, partial [Vibrio parahaemolyticus V-223/04]
MGIRKTR